MMNFVAARYASSAAAAPRVTMAADVSVATRAARAGRPQNDDRRRQRRETLTESRKKGK